MSVRESGLRSIPRCPPRAAIGDFLAAAVIGGPATVRSGFEQWAEATDADEFILVSDIFDADLRLRSLDIAAAARSA